MAFGHGADGDEGEMSAASADLEWVVFCSFVAVWTLTEGAHSFAFAMNASKSNWLRLPAGGMSSMAACRIGLQVRQNWPGLSSFHPR